MNNSAKATNWDVVKFADVVYFQEGPGVRKWQFTDVGVKLINVGNIQNGTLNTKNTERHVSTELAQGKYKHFLLDEGDLVMASSGVTWGKTAWVEKEHLPLCLNTSMIRIRPNNERTIDKRFLRYCIESREFKTQIQRLITGSAQPNFGPLHLSKVTIPLPPLSEQKRIAEILDQAEALRAKRRAALALLDELTQSIFLDMFGDAEVNSSRWPVKKVEEYVFEFQGGKSLESIDDDNSINRVLKVSAVTGMKFRPFESKPVPDAYAPPKEHFVKPNDLLFSRANTTELVGAVAYVSECSENLLLPDKLWRFVWKNPGEIHPLFIWFLFQTRPVRREIGNRATGTSGSMKNISKAKLNGIPTILPPFDIQELFANRVKSVENIKTELRKSLADFDALFASLQYRAFRGLL